MQHDEEEIVDLVNTVVDGEATPAQEKELHELLRVSRYAQELFDDTRDIVARLARMPVLDPPGVVWRAAVPAAVPARPAQWSRRRTFTFAWAAAAAIILAVILIDPLGFTRHDMSNSGATMAPAEAMEWPAVVESGSLIVRNRGSLYALEPVVADARPVTITMSWQPAQLAGVGISGGSDASWDHTTAKFTLRGPSERAGVIVRRRATAGAAEIRVWAGGRELQKTIVPLN